MRGYHILADDVLTATFNGPPPSHVAVLGARRKLREAQG